MEPKKPEVDPDGLASVSDAAGIGYGALAVLMRDLLGYLAVGAAQLLLATGLLAAVGVPIDTTRLAGAGWLGWAILLACYPTGRMLHDLGTWIVSIGETNEQLYNSVWQELRTVQAASAGDRGDPQRRGDVVATTKGFDELDLVLNGVRLEAVGARSFFSGLLDRALAERSPRMHYVFNERANTIMLGDQALVGASAATLVFILALMSYKVLGEQAPSGGQHLTVVHLTVLLLISLVLLLLAESSARDSRRKLARAEIISGLYILAQK